MHGALATISASFRSGPSFPYLTYQQTRRLSRVKLAVICGNRSVVRRQSCANCDCHCERRRFNIRIQSLRNNFLWTFHTKQDRRDVCFWAVREKEDNGVLHKRCQTRLHLARGGKVVRAGNRLGGGGGGWDGDRERGSTIRRSIVPLSSILTSTRYTSVWLKIWRTFRC